ncbi:Ig-like domain-containing protein [Sodalis sp. dw_96]|uniref:Ig-like domain-containing protein n=1 Tax=Sodalis sp. dw_96 TaxID=2719794 RepID=UPI001BD36546|nr:Ig-like domain-containing protein [Sodalis sp. dw_96]
MSEEYSLSNSQDGLYGLTMAATSNVRADGEATNSATARLYCRGMPVCGQCLDFEVTKNARFTSGDRCLSLQTNERGEATVCFTDTVAEQTVIICRFGNNVAFLTAAFLADEIDISVEVWVNNASANSPSGNQLFYRVFNVRTNEPIQNAIVDFSATGQATLSQDFGTTNQEGIFLLTIFNPSAGMVLVNAQVRGYPNADNHTFVTYTAVLPRYRLTAQVEVERPDGVTPVFFTLTDLNTGLPVPGQLLRVYCGTGATQTLMDTPGPTAEDGTARSGYYVAWNAINHMLVVLDIDETVNEGFILVGSSIILP